LFKAGSGGWSFLPQIGLPIFDGGVNRANLGIAKAERDIAVARYEKSIQVAFREVADALAQRGTVGERLAAQRALAEAASKSYRIHEARYRQGAESYLNALVSQRAWYAARQGLIAARLASDANQVTLYKALGGGWREEGADLASAAPAK
jgi:multidrug efflux system outer membrane protein